MKKGFLHLLWLCCVFLSGAVFAQAGVPAGDKRVALVIGNSGYPSSALENPRHDAAAMDAALQRLGFKVDKVIDGTKSQLDDAMKRLSRRADSAEVAAVFYAGHGIQVNGANYIVPIDARPQSERDLKREMVKLDDIIDDMGQAKVKLVFFDACRDNPLARSFSRGGSRGLAAPAEVSGTLISFATKHGNTAADGEGKNSPYTQALIAELNNPAGIEIETLLKNVNRKVKAKTKGQQEPWKYGSLDADFYFIFQGPTTVNVQQAPVDPETEAWQAAQRANTENAYRIYLDAYPRGRYLAAVRIALDGLNKSEPTKPETAAVPASGHVFRDCPDCPEMVIVPAGSFEMGSNNGGSDEKPVHTVRIGKPFAMGKTEVTQGQWRALMGSNPSHFSSCGDSCPVERVNWNDAREFARKLSQKTGKTYRLPSEAEWEHACRAGGTHTYCGSDSVDSVAWYDKNSVGKTRPVAVKHPNAWGLYDMSGNVWEWVEDCWNGSYNGAPSDGSAWTSGSCSELVLRGGSWDGNPQDVRATIRDRGAPGLRYSDDVGFRLARTFP